MRKFLIGAAVVVVFLVGAFLVATRTTSGQDALLARGLAARMAQPVQEPPDGGIRVFLCGTASPLPAPGRAQACVAVLVDERVYLVDAGIGSAGVASVAGVPLERLRAVLLTHFHSDHISGIADFNLISWARGRPEPLQIVGPRGVAQVVSGLNRMYELDRGYRVEHHGADLLPADLHVMQARTIEPGVILEEDGLVVTAFEVDHSPVAPAVGFRFDYGGRSVVVTGDTVVTAGLEDAARDADLLLSDAISLPIVRAMEQASRDAGLPRNAKIFADIQDYHPDTESLGRLVERANVRRLALYHLVPAPQNAIMERVFRRGLPDDAVLTTDGMTFDLPAGSRTIRIRP
jgi:ribonuclease Z